MEHLRGCRTLVSARFFVGEPEINMGTCDCVFLREYIRSAEMIL